MPSRHLEVYFNPLLPLRKKQLLWLLLIHSNVPNVGGMCHTSPETMHRVCLANRQKIPTNMSPDNNRSVRNQSTTSWFDSFSLTSLLLKKRYVSKSHVPRTTYVYEREKDSLPCSERSKLLERMNHNEDQVYNWTYVSQDGLIP